MNQPVTTYGRTNSLAIVSLVAAIAGYVIPHPFVASTIAVITGHMARGQIRRTGEAGKGLATAGLILGYIHLALSVVFVFVLALILIGAFAVGSFSTGSPGPATP